MILTIYILLQVIAILGLIATFFSKTPLVSAITAIVAAILMIGAWQINIGDEYVWDSSIRAYNREPVVVETNYLATINIMIFGLSLMFFIYDTFMLFKKEQPNISFNNGMATQNEFGKK